MPIIKTIGECTQGDILKSIASSIGIRTTDHMIIFQELFKALGYKKSDVITIDLGDWGAGSGSYTTYFLSFDDRDATAIRNDIDFGFTHYYDDTKNSKTVSNTKITKEGKTARFYNIKAEEQKNISLTHACTRWSTKTEGRNNTTNWDASIYYEGSKTTLFKNGKNGETFELKLTNVTEADIKDDYDLSFYQIPAGLTLNKLLDYIYKTMPQNCKTFSFTRSYKLPPYSGSGAIPFDKIVVINGQVKELLVTTDTYQLHVLNGQKTLSKRPDGFPHGTEREEMTITKDKVPANISTIVTKAAKIATNEANKSSEQVPQRTLTKHNGIKNRRPGQGHRNH